ncbi:MAG: hypothetical protein ACOCG4_01695 [Methanoculleus sp.]|jgi:hypothetical protein|nr:hypothetical protein [Methanoculleus sp.]
MPRVRINQGDLLSGSGVEGRRKRRRDEDSPAREAEAKDVEKRSRWRGRPIFDDIEGDIFYTKRG